MVYRSLSHFYGQLVDDVSGKTLVTASSSEKAIAPKSKKPVTKTELSSMVGKELATRAKKKKISKVFLIGTGSSITAARKLRSAKPPLNGPRSYQRRSLDAVG